MGSLDSWEQLTALERRASRKLDLDTQDSHDLGPAPETEASEPSTSGGSDTNENFQVGGVLSFRFNERY